MHPREILVRNSFCPIRAITSVEAMQALWNPDAAPNLGKFMDMLRKV